jgi:hypothetical protein
MNCHLLTKQFPRRNTEVRTRRRIGLSACSSPSRALCPRLDTWANLANPCRAFVSATKVAIPAEISVQGCRTDAEPTGRMVSPAPRHRRLPIHTQRADTEVRDPATRGVGPARGCFRIDTQRRLTQRFALPIMRVLGPGPRGFLGERPAGGHRGPGSRDAWCGPRSRLFSVAHAAAAHTEVRPPRRACSGPRATWVLG